MTRRQNKPEFIVPVEFRVSIVVGTVDCIVRSPELSELIITSREGVPRKGLVRQEEQQL